MSIESKCRLCSHNDAVIIDILSPEYVADLRRIHKLLPLKIKSTDELPTSACHNCLAVLHQFDKFCEMVVETQDKLRLPLKQNHTITENNEDCLNANKISEDGLQATLERGVSACSKKSFETCNNGDNVEDSAEDYTSDENKTNQKGKKMKSDTKKSENRTVTKNFRSFDNNEQSETDKNNSEDGNKSATKINKNAERELLEETTDESNGTKTKFKNHSSPIARILPEPPVLSSVKEECDDITIDLTSTVTERKRRLSDEHKSSDRNKISSTPAVVSTEKRQHLMDEHKSDRNKITDDEQRKTNIRVMSLKRDKHKTKHKMNSSSVVKDKQQELELNRVNPQQNEETIEEQPAVKENCWFRANLHSTNFIICNSCKTFLLDESAISKHKCQFETS